MATTEKGRGDGEAGDRDEKAGSGSARAGRSNRAAEGQRIQREAKQYVLHSWSVQNAINPIPVAGAEGRYFWDYDGKRYLDFASQLVNVSIGHQHPRVVAAIKEQADKLTTIGPPMAHEARSELARLLAKRAPGDLTMSFSTNGRPQANEQPIQLPRSDP